MTLGEDEGWKGTGLLRGYYQPSNLSDGHERKYGGEESGGRRKEGGKMKVVVEREGRRFTPRGNRAIHPLHHDHEEERRRSGAVNIYDNDMGYKNNKGEGNNPV